MKKLGAVVALQAMLSACGGIPPKAVTLLPEVKSGPPLEGQLVYSDPYSGVVTMPKGPGGESFAGRFVVVDRTAKFASQASLNIPGGSIVPATGSASSSGAGSIDAAGFWYATGDKGSTMQCELRMGSGGHGQGACQHSDGSRYQIVL